MWNKDKIKNVVTSMKKCHPYESVSYTVNKFEEIWQRTLKTYIFEGYFYFITLILYILLFDIFIDI